jgi:hypothetical protein
MQAGDTEDLLFSKAQAAPQHHYQDIRGDLDAIDQDLSFIKEALIRH